MHKILIAQATGIPYHHYCAVICLDDRSFKSEGHILKRHFSRNVPYHIAECQGILNYQSRFSEFARWHQHTGWPQKSAPQVFVIISLMMHRMPPNLVYLNLSSCTTYPQSIKYIYAIFQIYGESKKSLKIVILWIEKWVYAYCMAGNSLHAYSSLWLFLVFLLLWHFTSLKIYQFVSEIYFMKCTQ